MKDLYRRLGYQTVSDSIEESRIAELAQKDPTSARACRHILLNAKRKVVYDRNRQLMATIGHVRANLGLTRSENWTSVGYQDFDYGPMGPPSELEALREKLRESAQAATQSNKTRWLLQLVSGFLPLGFLIGVIWLVDVIQSECSNTSQNKTVLTPKDIDRNNSPALPTPPAFRELPLPLPENGTVTRLSNRAHIAPLRIVTRPHDTTHYYLKVVDWINKDDVVLTLFIRGGQSAETEVPVGTYELRYAAGTTWYGPEHRFGPETAYSKANKRFDFSITDNQVSGYTVEMYLQPRGNLSTERIDPDDF